MHKVLEIVTKILQVLHESSLDNKRRKAALEAAVALDGVDDGLDDFRESTPRSHHQPEALLEYPELYIWQENHRPLEGRESAPRMFYRYPLDARLYRPFSR